MAAEHDRISVMFLIGVSLLKFRNRHKMAVIFIARNFDTND